MSDENYYENLGKKQQNTKERVVDYQALMQFVQSNFPIWKTAQILKVVESWRNLPNSQTEFNRYASKLSSSDLDRLFEGITASTVSK